MLPFDATHQRRGPPGAVGSNGIHTLVSIGSALFLLPAVAVAQGEGGDGSVGGFRGTEAFTFLMLAIGPVHALEGFAGLTAGRDAAFKRELALYGTGAAGLAILLAGTVGVGSLASWGVSLPALTLAAGLLLLLVALRKLLGGSERRAVPSAEGQPRAIDLAFSPLATPTMIPPFGMAVVVLLLALAQQREAVPTVAGLVVLILVVDFVAMLLAEQILRVAPLRYALLLVGYVLAVLQVALAVGVIAGALKDLDVLRGGA